MDKISASANLVIPLVRDQTRRNNSSANPLPTNPPRIFSCELSRLIPSAVKLSWSLFPVPASGRAIDPHVVDDPLAPVLLAALRAVRRIVDGALCHSPFFKEGKISIPAPTRAITFNEFKMLADMRDQDKSLVLSQTPGPEILQVIR